MAGIPPGVPTETKEQTFKVGEPPAQPPAQSSAPAIPGLSSDEIDFFKQQIGQAPGNQPLSEEDKNFFTSVIAKDQDAIQRQRQERTTNFSETESFPDVMPDLESRGPSADLVDEALNVPQEEEQAIHEGAYAELEKDAEKTLAEEPEQSKVDYKDSEAIGRGVVEEARAWVGENFNAGKAAQCANFVRRVLTGRSLDVGNSKNPVDKDKLAKGEPLGPSFANSFFGSDVGTLIKDVALLRPGDIVGFANTYGNYAKGVLTHVGIYAGDGKIIHRSTKSAPVSEVKASEIGSIAIGVRPYTYEQGAPASDTNDIHPSTLKMRSRAVGIKKGFNMPSLMGRVFEVESRMNPRAVGPNKELGLGQIMPDTLAEHLSLIGRQDVDVNKFLEDHTLQMNITADVIERIGEAPIADNNWGRVLAAYKGGLSGLQAAIQDPSRLDGDLSSMRDFVATTLEVSPEEAKQIILKGSPDFQYAKRMPLELMDADDDDGEFPDYYLPTNYYAYHMGKNGVDNSVQWSMSEENRKKYEKASAEWKKDFMQMVRGRIEGTGKMLPEARLGEKIAKWEISPADIMDFAEAKALGLAYAPLSDEEIKKQREEIARAERLGLGDDDHIKFLKFRQEAMEDAKFRTKRMNSAFTWGLSNMFVDQQITEREEAKLAYKLSGAEGEVKRSKSKKGGWDAYVSLGWDEENNIPKEEIRNFSTKQEAQNWLDSMGEMYTGGKPNIVDKHSRLFTLPQVSGKGGWVESLKFNPLNIGNPLAWAANKAVGKLLEDGLGIENHPQRYWDKATFEISLPKLGGTDVYHPKEWAAVLGNTGWQLFNSVDALVGYVGGLNFAKAATKGISTKIGIEQLVASWSKDEFFKKSVIGKLLTNLEFRYELGFAIQAYSETLLHSLSRAWVNGDWEREGFVKTFATATAAAEANSVHSFAMGTAMMGGQYGTSQILNRWAQNIIRFSDEQRMEEAKKVAMATKDWESLDKTQQRSLILTQLEILEEQSKGSLLGIEEFARKAVENNLETQKVHRTAMFRRQQGEAMKKASQDTAAFKASINELIGNKKQEVAETQMKLEQGQMILDTAKNQDPQLVSDAAVRVRKTQVEAEAKAAYEELKSMENEVANNRDADPKQVAAYTKELNSKHEIWQAARKDLDENTQQLGPKVQVVDDFIQTQKDVVENTQKMEEYNDPKFLEGIDELEHIRDIADTFERFQSNIAEFYASGGRRDISFNSEGVPSIDADHYHVPENAAEYLKQDLTYLLGPEEARIIKDSYVGMLDSFNETYDAAAPASLRKLSAGVTEYALGPMMEVAEGPLNRAIEAISKMPEGQRDARMAVLEPVQRLLNVSKDSATNEVRMAAMDNLIHVFENTPMEHFGEAPIHKASMSESRMAALRSIYEFFAATGEEGPAQLVEAGLQKETLGIGKPTVHALPQETLLHSEFAGQKASSESFLRETEMHTHLMHADDIQGAHANLVRTVHARGKNQETIVAHVKDLAERRLIQGLRLLDEKGKGLKKQAGSSTNLQWRKDPVLRELSDALDIDNIQNIGKYARRHPDMIPVLETFIKYRNWAQSVGATPSNNLIRHNLMPKMFPRLGRYLEYMGHADDRQAAGLLPTGEYNSPGSELIRRISDKKKKLTLDQAENVAKEAVSEINTIRNGKRKFKESSWWDFVTSPDRDAAKYLGWKRPTEEQMKTVRRLKEDLLMGGIQRNAPQMVADFVEASLKTDTQVMALKAMTSMIDNRNGMPIATFNKDLASQSFEMKGWFAKNKNYVPMKNKGISGWEIVDPTDGKLKDVGDLLLHPEASDYIDAHTATFHMNFFDKTAAKMRNTILSGTPFPFLFQQFGQLYKSANLNMTKALGMFEIGAHVRRHHRDLVSHLEREGFKEQDWLSNIAAFRNNDMGLTMADEHMPMLEYYARDLDTPGPYGRTVRQSMEESVNNLRRWHRDSPWWKRMGSSIIDTITHPLDKLLRVDQHLNEATTFSSLRDAGIGATIFHTNRLWKEHGAALMATGKTFDEAFSQVQRMGIDYTNQITGSLPAWWISSKKRQWLFRTLLTPQWTSARITSVVGMFSDSHFKHMSPELRQIMKSEYRWNFANGLIGALTWANALSYLINGHGTADNPNGRVFDVIVGDYMFPNPFFGHDRQILDSVFGPAVAGAFGERPGRTDGAFTRGVRRLFALASPPMQALYDVGSGKVMGELQPDRELESAAELGLKSMKGSVGAFSDFSGVDEMTNEKKPMFVTGMGLMGSFGSKVREDSMVSTAQVSADTAARNVLKEMNFPLSQAVEALGRDEAAVKRYIKAAVDIWDEGGKISDDTYTSLTNNDKEKEQLYYNKRARPTMKQIDQAVLELLDPEAAGYKATRKALRDEFMQLMDKKYGRKKAKK